jgi:hypothetical protein
LELVLVLEETHRQVLEETLEVESEGRRGDDGVELEEEGLGSGLHGSHLLEKRVESQGL